MSVGWRSSEWVIIIWFLLLPRRLVRHILHWKISRLPLVISVAHPPWWCLNTIRFVFTHSPGLIPVDLRPPSPRVDHSVVRATRMWIPQSRDRDRVSYLYVLKKHEESPSMEISHNSGSNSIGFIDRPAISIFIQLKYCAPLKGRSLFPAASCFIRLSIFFSSERSSRWSQIAGQQLFDEKL